MSAGPGSEIRSFTLSDHAQPRLRRQSHYSYQPPLQCNHCTVPIFLKHNHCAAACNPSCSSETLTINDQPPFDALRPTGVYQPRSTVAVTRPHLRFPRTLAGIVLWARHIDDVPSFSTGPRAVWYHGERRFLRCLSSSKDFLKMISSATALRYPLGEPCEICESRLDCPYVHADWL